MAYSKLRCRACGFETMAGDLGDPCPVDCEPIVDSSVLDRLPYDPLIGRTLNEKYAIIDLIARGGLGKVYRAIQHPIRREVAIKVVADDQGDCVELKRRFYLEARAVAKLKHPAVVTLHDYGNDRGLLYMVLEYVEGQELAKIIAAEAPLDSVRVKCLAEQMLGGIAEAHAVGLIHRDLKPQNIMIIRGQFDKHERCKILDFGIAKLFDEVTAATTVATQTGLIIGTPAYLSPEQANATPLGPYSDIYSLGIVLYEMLTGKLPFAHPSLLDLLRAHCESPVPSMPEHLGVPPELEGFVRTALAKKPAERFADAGMMLKAFRASSTGNSSLNRRILSPRAAGSDASRLSPVSQLQAVNSEIESFDASLLVGRRRMQWLGSAAFALAVGAFAWWTMHDPDDGVKEISRWYADTEVVTVGLHVTTASTDAALLSDVFADAAPTDDMDARPYVAAKKQPQVTHVRLRRGRLDGTPPTTPVSRSARSTRDAALPPGSRPSTKPSTHSCSSELAGLTRQFETGAMIGPGTPLCKRARALVARIDRDACESPADRTQVTRSDDFEGLRVSCEFR